MVDKGWKSGFGRVVFLSFELCEQIWGGSGRQPQRQGGYRRDIIGLKTHIAMATCSDRGKLRGGSER